VAVVDAGGGVQAETAVMMVVVVPGEEFLAVHPDGLDRGEPGGESRPVLEGLELRFGVRVVVGDVQAELPGSPVISCSSGRNTVSNSRPLALLYVSSLIPGPAKSICGYLRASLPSWLR
jgi:hypothetical protein